MCHLFLHTAILCLGILLAADFASARWCSKMKKEEYVKIQYVNEKCNKSYQENCGWFSSEMCTHYEEVDCLKKYNRTLTRYRIVEECCRGFMLDPANNVTCIRVKGVDSGKSEVDIEEVNTVSAHSAMSTSRLDAGTGGDLPSNNFSNSSLGSYEEVRLYEDNDTLLLGLSHGAYAGIVCFLAFIICVIILVILNARKRFVRSKSKDRPLRMSEISESLMTSPQA